MFITQQKRYFPLPEYDFSDPKKVSRYIKNRAFDKDYYKDLVVKLLKKKVATREDIDDLLMSKLSNALSEKQKRTKIHNLLYEMATKDKTIMNRGSRRNPKWGLLN